jgi:PIN domain nuclease of toxin-antitoxin system
MKTKKVFDSLALLAFLNLEPGYAAVKDFFSSADILVLINEYNLGEVYYLLARGRGPDQAEYFLNTLLPSLPLHRSDNTFRDIIEAAKIKGQ